MAEAIEVYTPGALASLYAIKIIRNHLLLQKIAIHLPAQDLLYLRATCTDWNKTFLPQLKKKHSPIWLICELPWSTWNPSKGLARYTKVMQTSRGIPFTKYAIARLQNATDKELVDFFTKCGPTITSLEFGSVTMDRFSRILYEWTPELAHLNLGRSGKMCRGGRARTPPKALPKLKRLQFYGCRSPGLENHEDHREILEQAGQLRDFEFILGPYASGIQLLEDYTNCRHKLRALADIPLELEVFQMLNGIANQLRLERLVTTVGLGTSEREPNAILFRLFNTFLITQAGSLRGLEISVFRLRPESQFVDQIQIPKMEALNSFVLRQNGNWVRFEEQTLGATFPALKRLKFGGGEGGGTSLALKELAQLRHEGVTDLNWNWNSGLNLDALGAWFPGVTRLKLTVAGGQHGQLANLWNQWPALELLHIKDIAPAWRAWRLNFDQLLSGVRQPEMEQLKREFAEMEPSHINLEALRGLQREYKTRFGIGDQKHLQKIILEIHDSDRVVLSDIAGYLGLALAPQSLDIKMRSGRRGGTGSLVSRECVAFIREALGPFAVINL